MHLLILEVLHHFQQITYIIFIKHNFVIHNSASVYVYKFFVFFSLHNIFLY